MEKGTIIVLWSEGRIDNETDFENVQRSLFAMDEIYSNEKVSEDVNNKTWGDSNFVIGGCKISKFCIESSRRNQQQSWFVHSCKIFKYSFMSMLIAFSVVGDILL